MVVRFVNIVGIVDHQFKLSLGERWHLVRFVNIVGIVDHQFKLSLGERWLFVLLIL